MNRDRNGADSSEAKPDRLTIREVASLAGVSVTTVSRVLNGRPDVSEETREAVLKHVRATKYSSNRSARALSSGRTGLIGITAPNFRAEFFALIVSGASEALYEQDMRVVACPTLHEHDREMTLLDRLMHGTTDGAMLLLPTESPKELINLRNQGFPFVVVDPRYPVPDGVPSVGAAHASGAKSAVDHLIGLGHRRIAAITGPLTWCASRYRLDGYYAALASAGISPRAELIVEANFEPDGGHEAARRLLRLPQRPTAIFAFNDGMALGVLRAARELELAVPGDLSVVGFDDVEGSEIVTPKLTTVRQPLQEIGRLAAALLTRVMDGLRTEALRVDLETRLIIRESTAAPPG